MSKKMNRKEILEEIRRQGFGYLWTGTVGSYESLLSALYISARVIDDVPYVDRYFPRKEERGYEAWYVIMSPRPFRVLIRREAWEEKKYVEERVEEAERVEGSKLNCFLEELERKI